MTTHIIRGGDLDYSEIGKNTPAYGQFSPAISKGPAIINTGFVGTVTAAASTTVTFSSAADAILAGYHATAPVLGTTLITTAVNQASVTRYIQSWTNSTQCVVDVACTLAASSTLASVQGPIAVFVDNAGIVAGYINAARKMVVLSAIGSNSSSGSWCFNGVDFYNGNSGVQLWGGTPTATAPNIQPTNGDTNTGIGWGGADILSLIAGGANGINVLANGNVAFGAVTSVGTNAAKVLGIGEGTAPTTSPANMSQLWSADTGGVAGNNALHMRNEFGDSGPVAFSNIREVEAPSSITMGLNNVFDKRHTNFGQTLDAILTYNAGAAGQSGDIAMVTTVAKYYRLTPPSGAYFMLDGAPLAVNQSVQVASAAEGQKISWEAVKVGAAEWRIWLWTVSGPWLPV